MPNVVSERGFRMMIFPNDHEPMHVHVYYQGRTAVIEFEPEVRVRRNISLNRRELQQAVTIVTDQQDYLIQRWREIYA